MKPNTRQIIMTGLFTAITAVMAQISIIIPFSPVPITMQLFAVYLSAGILGSRLGFYSQSVYLLLGTAGIPVFANFGAGPGILIGPKGGYLISFPIMAFLIGYIIEKWGRNSRIVYAAAMLSGFAVCYIVGTIWLGIVLDLSPGKAIAVGMLPYIPLDLVKLAAAVFVTYEVRRILLKM